MHFYKFQATGNDFIIVDNRTAKFTFSPVQIQKFCDRKWGIGADGFIALNSSQQADFEMKFWNNDGSNSMMCGNGGRCIAALGFLLKIVSDKGSFVAPDGIHHVEILKENDRFFLISLSMCETELPKKVGEHEFFVNTGSPHLVVFVEDVANFDVYNKGKELRNDARFSPEGVNVDFVEILSENQLYVRTFERGVEDETLSCGTGVTASVLAYAMQKNLQKNKIRITTKGGNLTVDFQRDSNRMKEIYLTGAAQLVFEGNIGDEDGNMNDC